MKGTGLFLLCLVALAHGDTEELNKNGCPIDDTIDKLYIHENCDQYYQCLGGKLVARFCESGLNFNPEVGKCDWPAETTCHKVVKKMAKKVKKSKKPVQIEDLDNSNPNHAYLICLTKELSDVLIAHENCDEFYKCSFRKPIPLKCAQNLLFNPIHQKCDDSSKVECDDRNVPDRPDAYRRNNIQPTRNNVQTRSTIVKSNNFKDPIKICSFPESDGMLIPHESCNKFFKCFHGTPVSLKCPDNLLYNDKKQYCDWPRNVNCDDRIIPEKQEGGSEINTYVNSNSEENNSNETSGENQNSNSDPSKAKVICVMENSDGVLIAHEKCNMFYKCSHRQPIPLRCPENLLYNPDKEYCDWPINVNCGERILEKDDDVKSDEVNNDENEIDYGDPSQANLICMVNGSDGVMVAHENCNQFYKCHDRVPVAFKCPGVLLFNASLGYCDWPSNVECGKRYVPDPTEEEDNDYGSNDEIGSNNYSDPTQAAVICAAENSDGVMIAHEHCNQFYKCFDSAPVALYCQPNLLYNPNKEYCDFQYNVDCSTRTIPGTSDVEEANEEADLPCSGKQDDSIIPHENCNQFYKCLGGKIYAMNCPPGLNFNVELKTCDWPNNVKCGDRITEDKNHKIAKRGPSQLRFLK